LILKQGNTTGKGTTEEPGFSTLAGSGQSIENRDRLISWMDWAAAFRNTFSIINREFEMKNVLSFNNLLLLLASLLLLFVNWLAFHDFHEAHTVRDWLMLTASVIVLLKFAIEFWNQNLKHM
jgi:hypothetical protein